MRTDTTIDRAAGALGPEQGQVHKLCKGDAALLPDPAANFLFRGHGAMLYPGRAIEKGAYPAPFTGRCLASGR